MSASPYQRTCDELGVCQGRSHCAACAHPFAPGAIEHHTHSRVHHRRALLRWLRRAALFLAIVAVLPFVAGLITRALQP